MLNLRQLPDVEVVLEQPVAANDHLIEAELVTRSAMSRLLALRRLPNWNSKARHLEGSDLLHYTFYEPRRLKVAAGIPTVCTVYDMTPELFPEMFLANPHMAKARFVESSDAVILSRQPPARISRD